MRHGLLSSLLATSSHYAKRHASPIAFGVYPQLAMEEYVALAGVWRADLELDDGDTTISLHLADPQLEQLETEFPPSSNVYAHPTSERMPFSVTRSERGWESARWSVSRSVHAGAEGDDILGLTVQLGDMYLEGRGQRGGLRCRTFVGKVFQGGDMPRVIGRFSLRLALPIKTETHALERQYRERISSRPSRSPQPVPVGGVEEGDDERCEALSNLMRACAVAASFAEETALTDDCDAGDDVACETLSREEEAKRAWLANLEAPGGWGQRQEQEEDHVELTSACDAGDEVACETLSREEEAKRAWLARLEPPGSWRR